MRLFQFSGHMVLGGIGLIALAGIGLIVFEPVFATRLALSLGIGGIVLIVAGFLFYDMEKLRRKAKGDGTIDRNLK